MEKFQSLADGSSLAAESNELGGSSGYGLRENPKRTWRAVDSTFSLPEERVCKQCGKGFQSLKALCGHMACHSEKEKVLRDTHIWTSENCKLVDSHSDTEEGVMRQTRSKTKKNSVVKSCDNNINGCIEEQEMEDVAMCLMMLSRDSWKWGGVNSVVESSDNNSVVLETKSSSIDIKTGRNIQFGDRKLKTSMDTTEESVQFENSCCGYLRNGVKKVESEISIDEYKDAELGMIYSHYEGLNVENEFAINSKFDSKKRGGYDMSVEAASKNGEKKRKYECVNCNKSFNSFQALGGHRPCHKKTNPTFHLEYESDDNSLDDITPLAKKSVSRDFSVDAANKKKIKPNKKSKGHQCPFCFKMFKSGQALGGHKRTHFMNAPVAVDFNNPTPEIKEEEPATARNLIDLNLPAPEQDDEFDDKNQFIYLD